jgi:hypothetical protein
VTALAKPQQPPLPGSPQQRAACRPDVARFCRSIAKKDDVSAILSCLERNRSRIGRACREVISENGQ